MSEPPLPPPSLVDFQPRLSLAPAFSATLSRRIEASGVIAVLVIDRPEDAVPLVEALGEGGLDAIELTLRTPSALVSLAEIKRRFPQVLAGAGTVLTPAQVLQVRDAGADFAVAPGCNARVLAAAAAAGIPFGPGIATPSEIELAIELGCNLLKFFPAEPSGGLPYFKTMTAPYAHLGLKFIPLGGIAAASAAAYLADPAVAALGGSWIAPRESIQARDWAAITQRARQAMALVQAARGSK